MTGSLFSNVKLPFLPPFLHFMSYPHASEERDLEEETLQVFSCLP